MTENNNGLSEKQFLTLLSEKLKLVLNPTFHKELSPADEFIFNTDLTNTDLTENTTIGIQIQGLGLDSEDEDAIINFLGFINTTDNTIYGMNLGKSVVSRLGYLWGESQLQIGVKLNSATNISVEVFKYDGSDNKNHCIKILPENVDWSQFDYTDSFSGEIFPNFELLVECGDQKTGNISSGPHTINATTGFDYVNKVKYADEAYALKSDITITVNNSEQNPKITGSGTLSSGSDTVDLNIDLSEDAISEIASEVEIPVATTTELGGIKLFGDAEPIGHGNFRVELDNNNKAFVDLTDLQDEIDSLSDNSDVHRYADMSKAPRNIGFIVLYIGDTDSTYTNGYFYKFIYPNIDTISSEDAGVKFNWEPSSTKVKLQDYNRQNDYAIIYESNAPLVFTLVDTTVSEILDDSEFTVVQGNNFSSVLTKAELINVLGLTPIGYIQGETFTFSLVMTADSTGSQWVLKNVQPTLKLTSPLVYKGVKDSTGYATDTEALEALVPNPQIGWFYTVTPSRQEYFWNGTEWEFMGDIFDPYEGSEHIVISNDHVISTTGLLETLTAGLNIDITDNVIKAKGYIFTDVRRSFAEGYLTNATGLQSHAEGNGTSASGESSHSEGDNTSASGPYGSHAEGSGTVASGMHSHAEGFGSQSTAITAHAEGYLTRATGSHGAHSEGRGTLASGEASHAEGYDTEASGNSSHSEGNATIASGRDSHAEGSHTTAEGWYSHAEGHRTTASGHYSHAEGLSTIASGNCSHAEGNNTTSSGIQSHAEGVWTIANHRAHAEGVTNEAYGDSSHAEGGHHDVTQRLFSGTFTYTKVDDRTFTLILSSGNIPVCTSDTDNGLKILRVVLITPSSDYLIPILVVNKNNNTYTFTCRSESFVYTLPNNGNELTEIVICYFCNRALGLSSHVEGLGTITNNFAEHAEGRWNVSHDGFSNNETIHSIGIGNFDTATTTEYRKNAFEVMRNGDAYLYGVGGYQGTDTKVQDPSIKTLQESLGDKNVIETVKVNGSALTVTDKAVDITVPTYSLIQSDWNQNDSTAVDFIKNKPTIPTVPTNVSAFTNDAGYVTTDTNTAQIKVSDTANKKISTEESSTKYILFTGGTDKFTVSDGTNSFDVDVSHTSSTVNDGTYTVKTKVDNTTTSVSDFTANQSGTDDITFVQGSNVTLTPDATNREITIAATDTTYQASDFDIKDLSDSTNLRSTWSAKQDTSTAVTHTASTAVGSATLPVYIASDGTATATTYSLGKSVPSDAVFTDTTYTFSQSGNKLTISGGAITTEYEPIYGQVNDASLFLKSGQTNFAEFTANANNNVSVEFEAGEGIILIPDSTNKKLKIAATQSTAGLYTSGLHSQAFRINYHSSVGSPRCSVDNYTRLVAARSSALDNLGKITFMFEIISREFRDYSEQSVRYYAKYLFDGVYNGHTYDCNLYCLDYAGSINSAYYFHPINSICFVHSTTSSGKHLIDVFRKCLKYNVDDTFVLNVLMENADGQKSRDKVFNQNTENEGYSIQFWPIVTDTSGGDKPSENPGTILTYDNDIAEADIKTFYDVQNLSHPELSKYSLSNLPT